MIVTRQGRLKKAAALVPLALLSAAWTISISTTGAPEAAAGDGQGRLPDGTSIPTEALEVPASVTVPDGSALGVTGEDSSQIVSTSSASAIPASALAAYQRAETVINKADTSCRLPWQLVAAIGRVESNHGRANGNVLNAQGVSTPGVFGKALDGTGGTTRIADTDGGRYDGDTRLDRAVGPMQFIPSTWSTVGVDADGDGQRNPQDINDAALAAAVYLCSGDEDLSTDAGRSAAVMRYNHSASYVATVLAVMQSYLDGDFTAVPNATIPSSFFVPETPAAASGSVRQTKKHVKKHTGGLTAPHQGGTTHVPAPGSAPTTPAEPGTPSLPQPTPTAEPHLPTPTLPSPTLPPLPSTSVKPADQVLSVGEATTTCLASYGYTSVSQLTAALALHPLDHSLPTMADLNACVASHTG